MADLHIGAATYRANRKMDVFRQMAVISKVSPLLASGLGEIAPLIAQLRRDGLGMQDIPMERLGQIITPVSKQLAGMSEEDRRLVIGSCLNLIDRKDDGREGWQPVWNPDAALSNFDDVNNSLSTMLQLVFFALQVTFASFLPASLSASSVGAAA